MKKEKGKIMTFEEIVTFLDRSDTKSYLQNEGSIDPIQYAAVPYGTLIDEHYWVMDINGNWYICDRQREYGRYDLDKRCLVTNDKIIDID